MILRHSVLLMVLLTSAAVQAQTAARIARVVLYPGTASVERVARVAAGTDVLEVSGLAANFDVKSLRVEADGGIRLGEFQVQDVPRAEAINPRQVELESRLTALEDQIAVLEVERQSAELVTGYLKGLGEPAANARPAVGEARSLGATLEAIRQGGADALMRIQRVAVQKRALLAQQAVLKTELTRIASQNRDSRTLRLKLAAERAGDVRISYQVNGPGWQPAYRASLDSVSGSVLLERQALIAQNSGEDWQDVSVRLSTGQPRSAVQGQPPRPWMLSLQASQPAFAEFSAAKLAAPAPMLKASAGNEQPLFNVTEILGAFASEFEVPVKVSLPSDGRKLSVPLSRISLPVKLRVQTVPRQDTSAFLLASAERPEGVWLPGDIQLYRDGAYVGATHWNAMNKDLLELPFGRDDLVRVTVSRGKTQAGTAGFTGSRATREMAETYTVSNQHRQPVELLVLEPSPVGTHEDIQVDKMFDPKPSRENWEERQGVAAWSLSLPAGASQKIVVTYRISWPKASVINGLP